MRHNISIDPKTLIEIDAAAQSSGLKKETIFIYTFYEVINSWTDWSDEKPTITCISGEKKTTFKSQKAYETSLELSLELEEEILHHFSTLDVLSEGLNLELSMSNDDAHGNILISCTIVPEAEHLKIIWDIDPSFKHYKANREMIEAYQQLLAWISAGSISKRPPKLLSIKQEEVREEANKVKKEFPDQLLHAAFFEKASQTPTNTALLWDNEGDVKELTYGELAHQALSLGTTLSDTGVKPGDFVAVSLPKGINQIVAVLGILSAGAVYVPIAPDLPEDRQAVIRDKANVKAIVTDTITYNKKNQSEIMANVVLINSAIKKEPLKAHINIATNSLAYVIFTSGSTGTPKGVEITHQAAYNTICDINSRYKVSSHDRVLALSALDFDLSVYDVFGLLSAGGALVIPNEKHRKEATVWVDLIQAHAITIWNTVPALLDMLLLATNEADSLSPLRTVLVSGDWVGLDLMDRLNQQTSNASLTALGGATEASIWSNYYEINNIPSHWKSIPYGKPLANQKYRVCDPLGRDCPDYVAGELWIGGKGLSTGYLGEPDLTTESFIKDGGEKWYKTGDLGRYWADGNIEFLGRKDQQVKVRGFRIELGEIESTLKKCEGVGSALAAVHDSSSSKRLVAGVVEKIIPGSFAQKDQVKHSSKEKSATLLTAQESQANLVEYFLVKLLGLDQLNAQEDNNLSIASIGAIHSQEPLLTLWISWLKTREVIESDDVNLTKGKRLSEIISNGEGTKEHTLLTLKESMDERIETFRSILHGDISPTFLLEDEMLSPEALSVKDFGTCKGIEKISNKISENAEGKEGFSVGIMGVGTGVLTSHLLSLINNYSIKFTAMESSPLLLKIAAEKMTSLPHPIEYQKVDNEIPASCQYAFDMVVAIGVFHRYRAASEGPLYAKLMLKNQGQLIAMEHDSVSPLSHISAAVLEQAFLAFDNDRNITGSPMLAPEKWTDFLINAGFEEVQSTSIADTVTHLFDARCPQNRKALNLNEIRKFLSSKLPEHMLPEQLKLIPRVPLSANGKVDKKAFVKSFDLPDQIAASYLPHEGMETNIANMWKELLDIENIGRDQVFFQIGGDSLSATRFLATLKKEMGIELSLLELFDAPLSAVAETIETKINEKETELELIEEGEI